MTRITEIEKEEFSRKQDLNMGGLFQSIWNTRFSVLYSILAMLIFLIIMFLLSLIFIPKEQIFQSAINFTFLEQLKENEKEDLTYPNGVKFSLNDLVSPLVLEKVYKDNHLEKTKIKLKNFSSLVSVTPYSLAYKETAERYRKRLADRKLTFLERKEIAKNMSRDLKAQSQNNALIQLHYASFFGMSSQTGYKVVTDIPKVWSQVSIEQRGVLKLAQEIGNKPLVDIEGLKKFDYPVMLDVLGQSIGTLKNKLREFKKLDGSETIIDPKSGYSIENLNQVVKDIGAYEISSLTAFLNNAMIYKDAILTKSYLQERIFEETMRHKAIVDRIAAIDNILKDNSNDRASNVRNGQRQQDAVMPQIDKGFLTKIIEMSRKSNNSDLRKELILQKLEFQKKLAPKKYIILSLERSLGNVMKYDADKPNLKESEKIYSDRATEIGIKLNTLWEISKNLFHQLSDKRYSYNSHLYKNLALERNVLNYHPMMTKRMLFIFFIMMVLAGLIGMFISLYRQRENTSY